MRCHALFALAIIATAVANPVSAEVKFFYELAGGKYLQQILTETNEPVHSVGDIPPYVIAAARRITQDDFRLANPNERYISGCVRILPDDTDLPTRQLVFATKSSSHFLIFYRHGGVAQGQCARIQDRARPEDCRASSRWLLFRVRAGGITCCPPRSFCPK
jgi:hypothetical protein